ncbi:Alpha-N-acetylgalactosaminidase [Holothuria leucospilota]|uniref:Alpha-galactosidase n=1 Tax=Holothuria leucospilota TaxID=206669 RepID=A0A9Q1H0V4_HOLLE|nr:Alpha-N-acetylgalactosaminidase [Holothuria leucospilota]
MSFSRVFLVTCALALFSKAAALNNGLALLPPMGWQAWIRFRCNTDCDLDPKNCLREDLIRTMADLVVEKGFKDVGYEYINIDDCWMAMERDSSGNLVPDPKRFPSGMKSLADYVHGKGLKLGIYESMGYYTCQHFPGTFGYIEKDVQTFVDWGIDYVKMDTCHTPKAELVSEGFENFSIALNNSGRPVVFSCEWPHVLSKPDYPLMFKYCNTIRNTRDVQDSWDSVLVIIEFFAKNQILFKNVSGPGKYNDPDQLIIGDHSLSYEQSKTQMALWSIMAAQMLMSNDLRTLAPWAEEILKNTEVIRVNQDPLGIMGQRILNNTKMQIWTKPLSNGSYAAVFFSPSVSTPVSHTTTPAKLGFESVSAGYKMRDLFEHKDLGIFKDDDELKVTANPVGSVMIRADPVMSKKQQNPFKTDIQTDVI